MEQSIILMAARTGQPLPDRIANAPKLLSGLSFYMQAFFDLDSERAQSANGPGRIPWHAIQHYADYHNCTEEQRSRLHYFMTCMDVAHLKHVMEK